jgi:hypothetical protein
MFTLSLRPEDEARIQIEFDEFISQRNTTAAAKRARNEKAEVPITGDVLLTDGDL